MMMNMITKTGDMMMAMQKPITIPSGVEDLVEGECYYGDTDGFIWQYIGREWVGGDHMYAFKPMNALTKSGTMAWNKHLKESVNVTVPNNKVEYMTPDMVYYTFVHPFK